MITQDVLDKSYTYETYRDLVNNLLLQNKTTGARQTEDLVGFTKLNVTRMNRIEKTITIPVDVIGKLRTVEPKTIVLIGEAWCGDCAQIIPVIHHLVKSTDDKLMFKIILRDDNPEIMDAFLTNGARSIPKVIILDSKTLDVKTTWGPRPKSAQQIMLNWKANQQTITFHEFEQELHLWYAKNKGQEIITELVSIL